MARVLHGQEEMDAYNESWNPCAGFHRRLGTKADLARAGSWVGEADLPPVSEGVFPTEFFETGIIGYGT